MSAKSWNDKPQQGRKKRAGKSSMLLGAIFAFAGLAKLGSMPAVIVLFEQLGLPAGAMFLVGGVELAAVACLLVPPLRIYGAGIVMATMVGAGAIHYDRGVYPELILLNLLLFGVGLWVMWCNRPRSLRPGQRAQEDGERFLKDLASRYNPSR